MATEEGASSRPIREEVSPDMPSIIMVGVATYRRNAMLEECLASLDKQTLVPNCKVVVAVADNSPDKQAEATVRSWSGRLKFDLCYLSEPQRGISEARNKLVDHAVELKADYLAFIDDDEVADPDWLFLLHAAIKTSEADVVQGAVRYLAEVSEGERSFLRIKARPELEVRQANATGNVIFGRRILYQHALRFDRRFSLTGGGDFDFFLRSHLAGDKHVWTNSAVVSETVPAGRQGRNYRVRRLFRTAAAVAYSERLRIGSGAVFKHVRKGGSNILLGLTSCIVLPFSLFSGRNAFQDKRFRIARRFAKGCGAFVGLLGLNIRMYK